MHITDNKNPEVIFGVFQRFTFFLLCKKPQNRLVEVLCVFYMHSMLKGYEHLNDCCTHCMPPFAKSFIGEILMLQDFKSRAVVVDGIEKRGSLLPTPHLLAYIVT